MTALVTGDSATVPIERADLEAALVGAAAAPSLDLRQGVFARRRRFALDWALIRRLAVLAGLILAVTLAISLVKEGDQWKLDSLDEFVSFDKDSFAAGLLEGAASDGETPQPVLDCVEQAVNDTSDEELQTIYLSGDEQQLLGLFGQCFQG